MPIFLTALGTVTPYMSVTVKARVSGELLPVKFTEGQQVRQGETIMVIDPRPYQAALDQAKGTLAHDQALLKNAQAEYARYKALYDAGVTSKETLDADEATQGQYQGAIEADKAAIETAQLQLELVHHPVADQRPHRPAPGGSRQHHHRQHHQPGDHQPVPAHRRVLHLA